MTGSCTAAFVYWSSTTDAFSPGASGAWGPNFINGSVGNAGKDITFHVRAVRGGSP